ncbi:galactokinase [Thalassotalea euphylliae]|uniref:Galactokinase n=1 Tax=Thalassotalea euphylliae TaxID=1655234 RepID=A0A3E0TNP8_9GAMM|nr:galactokinase [Thalassotalea euphylliae]REL25625.1 galactokinase [Thalassotalea euphylliae]
MTNNQFTADFQQLFGHPAQGLSVAPGRVNLIGEFTDYNLGYVLPCALNFSTQVLFKTRDDKQVVVYSNNYPGEQDSFSIDNDIAQGDSQWGNYIRAVVYVLKKRGYALGGIELLISSDVPQGAGLSSSAALEVSIAGAFNQAFNLRIDTKTIALIGQQAENEFMHCQCGIMDQLISAQAEAGHALKIDCDDLSTEKVLIPEDLNLVIVNSNYPRKLVESEYNQRRLDCEGAAQKMQVSSLRQANLALLEQTKAVLTENEYKRAFHVLSENQRVVDTVTALANNSMDDLRDLLAASHQSLRDNFEVTVPATDGLVDIISRALEGKGAVRMTGGGFGGAVICLCRDDEIAVVKAAVEREYQPKFDLHADIFVCQAGTGLAVNTVS